jgi:putative flippase GtrA
MFVSLFILAFLVEAFHVWYIASKIISMLIAFNLNYYLQKRHTFSKNF